MNKRDLKRYIKQDDSFFGELISRNTLNIPFDILIPFQKGIKDNIPRIYIIGFNDENPYKLKTTKIYQIINGKIQRLDLYKRNWNIEEETYLQEFVTKNLNNILKYFYGKIDFIEVV